MAASAMVLFPTFSGLCWPKSSSSPPPPFSTFMPLSTFPNGCQRISHRRWVNRESIRKLCRAMVQTAVQGPSAAYAREMERLSAKESLLLALKDAGGFEGFVTGRTTEMQRIDVTERITGLECLNPTPRPTTSPFVDGRWNVEWFGPDTPGLFAFRFAFERLPTTLANLSKLECWFKDGNVKLIANLRLLNAIGTKLTILCKLSVEGPLRMKEEYVEGMLESPSIIEEAVPEQLKSVVGQASSALQQLPVPIRDLMSSGLTVPLGGTFERLFMISYLDDEILIIRGSGGLPSVFTRLDPDPSAGAEPVIEYES
ncbi:Probable plastid-lipid-associated protein 13, chloroplastic [Ancistrocladus abbreviatus]